MDCELTLPTGDNTAFPSPHSTRSFPLTPAGFELEAPHAEPSPALPARHKPLTVRGSRGQPRPGPTFEPAPRERARPARGGEYPRPPRRGHPGRDACTHWKAGAVPGIRRDSQGLGGGVAAIAPPRLRSAPIDSDRLGLDAGSASLGSARFGLGLVLPRPLAGATRERRAIPPAALRVRRPSAPAERCALPLY